ncbi:MAG: TolC family protein [Bacteroidetes bacterium]|nr:TolC family protein [Bacteroidota bacterium]
MKLVKALFVTAAIIFNASTSDAQSTGASISYSLTDCLNVATSQNYDVQIAKARLRTATADIQGAFGQFLPSVSFNMGYQRRLNTEGGGQFNLPGGFSAPANSYSMNLGAQYTIFNGFSRESNYSRAQSTVASLESTTESVSLQTKYLIWQQFIAILKNGQIVKTRRENLELGNNELKRAKARQEAGVTAIGTVYAQEADNGSRELELVQSENQMNLAKATLLTTMGLNPAQNAEFTESSLASDVSDNEIKNFRMEIGSMDAAISHAVEKRPDYAAVKSRIQAAESSLEGSRSGYYPTLSASGGWSWQNTEFDNFSKFGSSTIGLNLRVPIFENFTTNTQIQNAKLEVTQRQIEQAQLEQTLKAQVQSAFLNLASAEKQLEITARTVRSAQQNYNSAQERFNVGAASVTDYLTANTQLINSKINRITAVYNYFEAQSQMRYVLGDL